MKIIVDADHINLKPICNIAKQYKIPVIAVHDTAHPMKDVSYATCIMVDQHKNASDTKIANITKSGDIVISNDRGVNVLTELKGGIPLRTMTNKNKVRNSYSADLVRYINMYNK